MSPLLLVAFLSVTFVFGQGTSAPKDSLHSLKTEVKGDSAQALEGNRALTQNNVSLRDSTQNDSLINLTKSDTADKDATLEDTQKADISQMSSQNSSQDSSKMNRKTEPNPDSKTDPKIHSKSYPKKRPAKEPWEHVVSAPGYLLNAPFWVLNKGMEKSIYFIDEHKIVPKVKRVLISHDETRVIMPAYDSEIGSGVKVTKKKLFSDSSLLVFGANQGLDPRRGVKLYLFDNPLYKTVTYDLTAEHRNLYDAKFFGLGPDTKISGESEYLNTEVKSEFTLKIKPRPTVGVALKAGYHYHNIEDGESIAEDDDSEPSALSLYPELLNGKNGFVTDLNLASIGAALTYNSLSPSGHPLTGLKSTFSFDVFMEQGHSTYHFTRSELDVRKYFHLFYDRSLMLRLNSTVMRSINKGSIPFYYLSELGATGTIRGFDRGRFRDRDRVFATVEYRYPIWSPEYRVIEAVVFGDAGQVANDLSSRYDWERMQYGYGFGIRAYSKENRVLSMEFGFSKEFFRVYFILN